MVSGAPDFWITGKYIDLIDTLDTLKTIELIKKIEQINPTATENVVIDRIDLIKEIRKISAIRDVTLPQRSIILNSDFEREFAGWAHHNAEITDEVPSGFLGFHSVKFAAGGYIKQMFPLPWNTDWLAGLDFVARSPTAETLGVVMHYHDLSPYTQFITMTTAWATHSITLEPNKYVIMLSFTGDDTRIFCVLPRF